MTTKVKALFMAILLAGLSIFPVHSQPVEKKGPKAIPPEYTVLAIYSVEARGVSQEVADGLTPHLVFVINKHRGKVQVVQNEAVEKALEQVGLAASGACTDTVCLPELGKILGANRFLVSSIAKLGERYTIYMTVFDAETGIEVLSDIEKCKCPEDELGDALERLTIRVMARLNGKKAEQPPKPKPLQPGPKPEPQGPAMIQGNSRGMLQHSKGLKGPMGMVTSLAFSPDGRILASASADKKIKLWDVATSTELRTLEGHGGGMMGWIFSVDFSPDGKILASGSGDKTIKLWDVQNGNEIRTLSGHDKAVTSVAFSKDGKILASGSKKTIKIWDVSSGAELKSLEGHNKQINSITFSPDNKVLASGSNDSTIKIWDTTTWNELRTLTGHTRGVLSISFNPADGKVLASGAYDKTIKFWNIDSGKEVRSWKPHDMAVQNIAFSPPDGKVIVSIGGSGGFMKMIVGVKFWDMSTGNELMTIEGQVPIFKLAFSPDGRILALGCMDGTVRLYE